MGSIGDKIRLAFLKELQTGYVMKYRQHTVSGFSQPGKRNQRHLKHFFDILKIGSEGILLGAAREQGFFKSVVDLAAAKHIQVVLPHHGRRQMKPEKGTPVGFHQAAVKVKEHDRVVHMFQNKLQLLFFRRNFIHFLFQTGSQMIQGQGKGIDLIACTYMDPFRQASGCDPTGDCRNRLERRSELFG